MSCRCSLPCPRRTRFSFLSFVSQDALATVFALAVLFFNPLPPVLVSRPQAARAIAHLGPALPALSLHEALALGNGGGDGLVHDGQIQHGVAPGVAAASPAAPLGSSRSKPTAASSARAARSAGAADGAP